MKSKPIDPAGAVPLDGYVPVETERQRHDGWTEERQMIFLLALTETGSITRAAEEAGITARSAYRLRAHPHGKAFADAWDQALRLATGKLLSIAYERALVGTPVQHWRDGKLVGETRAPSDRLLIFLLSTLRPFRYSPASAQYNRLEITANEARQRFDDSLGEITENDLPIEPSPTGPSPLLAGEPLPPLLSPDGHPA